MAARERRSENNNQSKARRDGGTRQGLVGLLVRRSMGDTFFTQVYAVEAGPGRRLIIRLGLVNPYNHPITGVEVLANVYARVGSEMIQLAEGLRGHVGRGEPPSRYYYPPSAEFELILMVNLSKDALGEIETLRTHDIALSIMGDVIYSIAHRVSDKTDHWLMGDRRWDVLTDGNHPLVIPIPQSEWLKHLKRLNWSDYEVLEIPRNKASDARFARAYAQLAKASTLYRNGEWDGCGLHCRRAFEAVMKDSTRKKDIAQAAEILLAKHPTEKKEALNGLLLALGRYTHLARHEGAEAVSFDKYDAAQVFFMTTAAVDFIANQKLGK